MHFEYAAPFLIIANVLCLITKRIGISLSGIKGLSTIAAVSALAAFSPIGGLSLSDYMLSINPVFSMGTLTFFSLTLYGKVMAKRILRERDVLIFSVFNIALYAPLAASSLGFVPLDIYAGGYGFPVWFLLFFALTAAAIFLKSRLSIILVSYIVGYDLKLLPSWNFLDYSVDGFLFFVSAAILIKYIYGKTKGKKPYETATETAPAF